MGDDRPERPRLGAKAKTEAELRRQRQAKALRENLRRRKAHDASSADRPPVVPSGDRKRES